MAQHLPPEVLFHIFTTFSSPDQYLNGLMLVCRNWYEITNYEMFWLATLKNLMKQQIHECNNNEKFETLLDTSRVNLVIKSSDILKERKSYLSSIEKKEKILVIDLKPFTKRRETNDDIYGNSYKGKSIQFIKERRRRLVVLELAQLASEFENDIINEPLFENKWKQIISTIENSKYYRKEFIANLGIFNSSTTIFHIFIKQCQVHFAREIDPELFDRVVSFFIYDCSLPVLSYIENLVKARGFLSLSKERENNQTIFEKLKNEINFTGKSGVPSHLLSSMILNASTDNEKHVDFIRKCIEVFKSKKLLRFKENMVEPYMDDYMKEITPNWLCMELLLKDMNLIECKGFDHYQFIRQICQKIYLIDNEPNLTLVENLKRANKEFGLRLDIPLPRSLTSRSNMPVLELLVENGADVNSPPPMDSGYHYKYGVPLSTIIYNSYSSSSRSKEILYMIEKGAVLPPMDTEMPTTFYESYSYADIFNYYSDAEEVFLTTLKLLVDKFGPRFSGATPVIESLKYSEHGYSLNGVCEVLRYLKQVTNLQEDIICEPLTDIYCEWGDLAGLDFDKEQFREFLENEMGIKLVPEIIEKYELSKNQPKDEDN